MSHLGAKDFENRSLHRYNKQEHIVKALYGDIEKGGIGSGKKLSELSDNQLKTQHAYHSAMRISLGHENRHGDAQKHKEEQDKVYEEMLKRKNNGK